MVFRDWVGVRISRPHVLVLFPTLSIPQGNSIFVVLLALPIKQTGIPPRLHFFVIAFPPPSLFVLIHLNSPAWVHARLATYLFFFNGSSLIPPSKRETASSNCVLDPYPPAIDSLLWHPPIRMLRRAVLGTPIAATL